ncbi:LppU/SCO3897 family protein [Amycolatopsis samaneae]|uniref:Tat pathway signal sequence domain protein n=1 Tax=Amycolatopsis samaneae TaxID=664691 RepID=A0ABW5GIZ7_9PSEU
MTTPTPEHNPFQPPEYPAAGTAAPATAQVPARRPVSTRAKVLIGAGLVVALGAGSGAAFGVAALVRLSGTPVAGNCVYLTDEASGQQAYHGVTCSEQRATYKVDNVVSGPSTCRGGDYLRFRIYGTTGSKNASKTLCLALNVSSGDCLRELDDDVRISKVSCTDPAARARATVHFGSSSEDGCGAEEDALVYAGPPARTVCLSPAGQSI